MSLKDKVEEEVDKVQAVFKKDEAVVESDVDKAEEKAKERVKKIEQDLHDLFTKNRKEADQAAIKAREEEPSTDETRTAYVERISQVPGIFGDNQHAVEVASGLVRPSNADIAAQSQAQGGGVVSQEQEAHAALVDQSQISNDEARDSADEKAGGAVPAGPMDEAVNHPGDATDQIAKDEKDAEPVKEEGNAFSNRAKAAEEKPAEEHTATEEKPAS